MEVIVDDSQLSLAIGKKGQNVRLAAKLLGWKVDIKSEEEKRQEVESAMAALVNPPEPVASLIAYGLSEEVAALLAGGGIEIIDKLGGMTPEQLQEIAGIDPEMVENIRDSVTAYYSQFEEPAVAVSPEDGEVEPELSDESSGGVPVETEASPASDIETGAQASGETDAPAHQETSEEAGEETVAAETQEPHNIEMASESDTILDSGRDSHDESDDGGSHNE